jgi:hypothetical protein
MLQKYIIIFKNAICLECLVESKTRMPGDMPGILVAPSDIISNLFLEDLERIWELRKWIPDPCNPYLHYLKHNEQEEDLR